MKKFFIVLGHLLLSIALLLFSAVATTVGLTWVLIPFGITMGFWTALKMLMGLILVVETILFMTRHTK